MSRRSWHSLFEALSNRFTSRNTIALRKRPHIRRQRVFETLEDRRLLTVLPPVDPINPSRGESNLLRVVQMHSDKLNLNAQDHFPVPFTVFASAGNSAVTVKNWKAGAPLQLDADGSKATGMGGGGQDIRLEVNTDQYTNDMGQPDWRLRLNVERLGTSKFAQNLSVVVSFPFDGFNSETMLPGAPNLMMGFQTRLPGLPGDPSYIVGLDGGIAPQNVQIVLTPHVLAGTTHTFEWDILTSGATNPITFMSGEFDGNNSTGILNAMGWQAYVQNVPAHITAQIKKVF